MTLPVVRWRLLGIFGCGDIHHCCFIYEYGRSCVAVPPYGTTGKKEGTCTIF